MILVSSHLSACPLLREHAALKYLPMNPPQRKSALQRLQSEDDSRGMTLLLRFEPYKYRWGGTWPQVKTTPQKTRPSHSCSSIKHFSYHPVDPHKVFWLLGPGGKVHIVHHHFVLPDTQMVPITVDKHLW